MVLHTIAEESMMPHRKKTSNQSDLSIKEKAFLFTVMAYGDIKNAINEGKQSIIKLFSNKE